MQPDWKESIVQKGDRIGRTIGFPTLNLDPRVLPEKTKRGVYYSLVQIKGKQYKAALYFGPRFVLDETKNVLEIFVFDFHEEIYGEKVTFLLKTFIRPDLDFPSLDEMTKQVNQDIEQIRSMED